MRAAYKTTFVFVSLWVGSRRWFGAAAVLARQRLVSSCGAKCEHSASSRTSPPTSPLRSPRTSLRTSPWITPRITSHRSPPTSPRTSPRLTPHRSPRRSLPRSLRVTGCRFGSARVRCLSGSRPTHAFEHVRTYGWRYRLGRRRVARTATHAAAVTRPNGFGFASGSSGSRPARGFRDAGTSDWEHRLDRRRRVRLPGVRQAGATFANQMHVVHDNTRNYNNVFVCARISTTTSARAVEVLSGATVRHLCPASAAGARTYSNTHSVTHCSTGRERTIRRASRQFALHGRRTCRRVYEQYETSLERGTARF